MTMAKLAITFSHQSDVSSRAHSTKKEKYRSRSRSVLESKALY